MYSISPSYYQKLRELFAHLGGGEHGMLAQQLIQVERDVVAAWLRLDQHRRRGRGGSGGQSGILDRLLLLLDGGSSSKHWVGWLGKLLRQGRLMLLSACATGVLLLLLDVGLMDLKVPFLSTAGGGGGGQDLRLLSFLSATDCGGGD